MIRHGHVICRTWLSGIIGLLFAVSHVAAETVIIDAIQDTTLYGTPAGDLSNGAGEHMFVGRNGAGGGNLVLRTLVRFNIRSLIPSGATLNSVELQLNISPPQQANTGTVAVHRVLEAWGEGVSAAPRGEAGGAPAEVGDATWLHTFFNTLLWQTPGGDFVPEESASLGTSFSGLQIWTSTPQLVADVQSWVDDPATNFGWLLKRADESQPSSAIRFDTRQSESESLRPQLVVDFTPGEIVGLDDPIPVPIPQGDRILDLERVANGFTAPVWGTHIPGDTGRLFVVDQTGVITAIDLLSGGQTAFLNASDRLVPLGAFGDFDERGLLGVAFHPDYATNGRLYTGILIPDDDHRAAGTAVISFNPHTVAGDARGSELHAAGANGDFSGQPGKIISFREIRVRDNTGGPNRDGFFQIHDHGLTRHQVEVEWNTTGGGRGDIREISYMIVGDA